MPINKGQYKKHRQINPEQPDSLAMDIETQKHITEQCFKCISYIVFMLISFRNFRVWAGWERIVSEGIKLFPTMICEHSQRYRDIGIPRYIVTSSVIVDKF